MPGKNPLGQRQRFVNVRARIPEGGKAFCGAEKARNGEGRSPPGPAGTAGIHHAARPSGAAPARLDSLWQPATVWQMPADKGRVMTWSFLLFLWQ